MTTVYKVTGERFSPQAPYSGAWLSGSVVVVLEQLL